MAASLTNGNPVLTLELHNHERLPNKPAVKVIEPAEVRYDFPSIWVEESDCSQRFALTGLILAIAGEDVTSHSGSSVVWVREKAVSRVVNTFAMLGIENKLVVRKASQDV